ncbi:M3 family metallopeptidase [Enterovirga rhinocerotis]|uniref:Peptidyl-dipeptidase Dcp n=1 Tax=Enterovirga rhinocerotis TaxID=1339210 RepID=A0A4V3DZ07_9HYPH|nr:M3 family metallopeptidase [Enterovirga rhinocerotis]TDR94699.1 peptidyl-dipeptidase Dcp [Enterovirga rhinocerotis]
MTKPLPTNPLLAPWDTPFGVPPFEEIAPGHVRPALDEACAEHLAEIAAIRDEPAPADFENTIAALERAGRKLDRVTGVFYNLAGAHTNEALQAVEREVSPILARHWNAIYLDPALFRRIDEVKGRAENLDAEQARVLDNYHRAFRRQGAGLPDAERRRLAEIAERLASLGTQFGQNVLADEQSFVLPLETEADLAGLPDFLRIAARQAAEERGLPGHVVTLARSLIEPFLQYSTRRDLRERAFAAWTRRGETGGTTDNRAIVAETVRLRAERARILGFPSYAHFRLEPTMAKTPEAAQGLLRTVWGPARELALAEARDLQEMADRDGASIRIGPQDWRHYAERVRKERYDFDAAALKPYLTLERMIEAAFDCASRLFGVSFVERFDIPRYHPDVRAFEVKNAGGETIGLFLGDYFARPSKRSGAWMSAFRRQRKLDGIVRPIIVNVMNFAEGAEGGPTLLSFDDARTLFHEFGHALHGLLSDVTYPSIAGTSVARDFVEFPSQLFEHWLDEPSVLARFATHAETGEPMPPDLVGRLQAARKFNQGFATVEYVSSALVDLDFHLLPSADNLDVGAFERASLDAIGMPEAITMRHRTPHFTHVFSGEGYASSYYSYMWSEVLDADGFAAFEEAGDPFDPETAKRLKDYVYAAGDRREPDEAYTLFRGRLPSPEALLRQRGLAPVSPQGEM